jgi:hypothetical protein
MSDDQKHVLEGITVGSAMELAEKLRAAPCDPRGVVWLVAVIDGSVQGEPRGIVVMHDRAALLMRLAGVSVTDMANEVIADLLAVYYATQLALGGRPGGRYVGARLVMLPKGEAVDLVVSDDEHTTCSDDLRIMLDEITPSAGASIVASVRRYVDQTLGEIAPNTNSAAPHKQKPRGDA